jgi:lipoprotein-releasing system permease protein
VKNGSEPSRGFSIGKLLFIVFAPITVPAYLVFLTFANLLGGAYYIVIEATASRLAGKPISLSRSAMAALSLPILIAAPFAAAAHLLLWMAMLFVRMLAWVGRWQVGMRPGGWAIAAGTIWALAAFWTTVTCLNAAIGSGWVGRPVKGADLFVENITRHRSLGELPAEMQSRRSKLLRQITAIQSDFDPQWEHLQNVLADDGVLFGGVARRIPLVARKLADMPWYYHPAEISEDGLEHSVLMLGPLFLVWVLLVRWPGTFAILRGSIARGVGFALRVVFAVGAIYYLITWDPLTSYADFWFDDNRPTFAFQFASPAFWFGIDPFVWVRPEWYLFNAGLWIVLILVLSAIWRTGWRISPFLAWPRYYIAFFAARLLQRRQIAFFSVGAVTLCVAMMIIVISVMGGFVDSIRERAHGLLGDLVMDGDPQGFPYYEPFIKQMNELRDEKTGRPLVVQATPLIHTYGILQFPRSKKTVGVRIWGIRLEEYVRVNEFGRDLFYNNRFGGTTLGPQLQPAWGFDASGVARLPAEMEAHYEQYLAKLDPEKREIEAKKNRREKGDPFPGPGVIDGPEDTPGFTGKPYPGVILGRSVIFRRQPSGEYSRSDNYPRGEKCVITVLPLTRGGDVSPEPPPKPVFRYIDDSRTGIHEIDSMNVYVDFAELQRLLSMVPEKRVTDGTMSSSRCSQIQIKIDPEFARDRETLRKTKAIILDAWNTFRDEQASDPFETDMLRQVDIQTWEEMQRSYISAIEKEKFLVLIMFGVISIVAVFLILTIFYMIVQEKTRDIGIIKTVGGSAEGVAAVFLAYGGAIGLVGCILGSLLGIVFVDHINEIQDWLARINPDWRVWSPETYSFDKIPSAWKWSEVIGIGILGIASSIIGAAFPAIRAGRTWPVESLRYE